MREADWPGAEAAFRESTELYPTQAGLFNLGSAVLAQDRPADALEVFDDYLRRYAARASSEQLDEVERMRRRALGRLCRVVVEASPEGAEVLVDGELVGFAPLGEPLLLSRGEHRVEARREGYRPRRVSRRFEGGCAGEVVELHLRPRAPRAAGPDPVVFRGQPGSGEAPPRATALAGWVLLAAAGATAAAASVTGGLTLSLHQDFGQFSMEDSEGWGPVQDRGRALALTTDILIGIAAAAAVISIPLVVYGHRRPRQAPR